MTYDDLIGGFFAGKLSNIADKAETGSRFDDSSDSKMAAMYRKRYINDAYISALDILKDAAVRPFYADERGIPTRGAIALT
jgi:hypothetical protein